ncbi:hypothetical protein DRJ17_04060 [Candidatus Woesearchaeota archaeon]|nr:MAG: hypothetical protein DRJ17_04060 [Candidatus Woesearchaeota archaeon]
MIKIFDVVLTLEPRKLNVGKKRVKVSERVRYWRVLIPFDYGIITQEIIVRFNVDRNEFCIDYSILNTYDDKKDFVIRFELLV